MTLRNILAVSALVAVSATLYDRIASAQTAPTVVNSDSGLLLLVAFQCSQYAALSGNAKEQERLFLLGYATGKRFVDAARNQKISPQDLKEKVPLSVLQLMEGPTTDFMVGRIFEYAATDAFDSIAKRDPSGVLLSVEKWMLDKEVLKIKAENKYRESNCSLIK